MLCLIVLIAVAFYFMKKGKLGTPSWAGGLSRSPGDAALAKLHQRFADGDLTPEDYTTRVRLIREHAKPGGAPTDDLGTPRA